MEKEKFEEIINKLHIPRNKFHLLHEIDNIQLTSGKGIYPNWKYLKFLITDMEKLIYLIKI